jgi:hypothetical protein
MFGPHVTNLGLPGPGPAGQDGARGFSPRHVADGLAPRRAHAAVIEDERVGAAR